MSDLPDPDHEPVCPVTRGPHRWAVIHRKAPIEPRTECQGCGAVQVPRYPFASGGRS